MNSHSVRAQDNPKRRTSAEELLDAKSPDGAPHLREGEYARLVHELQVHQLELELQNDELARTSAELETSRDEYTDLYDFAPVAYFTLDCHGTIQKVNLAGASLFHLDRSHLLNRNFADLVALASLADFTAFLADVLNTDSKQHCEASLTDTGFPRRAVRIEGVRLCSSGHTVCRMALVDITDRIEKDEEISRLYSTLEQQVTERTAQLAAANAALVHALLVKNEFLATMSHELRTPLTAILAMSEGLQVQIYGELNNQQSECIKGIERSGMHLLALINDLLDLSVTEAGQFELHKTRFGIAEVCLGAMQMVTEIAKQKRLHLKVQTEPSNIELVSDYRRVEQILINLLGNAVKFTPDGGRIELIAIGDAVAHTVTFCVEDSGIGIANENLGRIFQPFVQLDSGLSRHFEGAGLGLVLVRRLTELCGGQVSVESVLGQGSRFCVALPLPPDLPSTLEIASTAITPPVESRRAVASATPGPQILLAEDDAIIGQAITD
ncbi:MAG: hypothetical protein IPK16_21725 [Anaerolineales bacterium]|nr:hypothetical protein [Anaerolineales bacterium]